MGDTSKITSGNAIVLACRRRKGRREVKFLKTPTPSLPTFSLLFVCFIPEVTFKRESETGGSQTLLTIT